MDATPPARTNHGYALCLAAAVPVVGTLLVALGWILLETTRPRETGAPEVVVALTAAATGILVCAWWTGGVLMASLAHICHRLGWHRAHGVAARMTPRVVARAVAVLAGLQLLSASPALATDAPGPVSPFWGASDLTTEPAPGPLRSTEAPPTPSAPEDRSVEGSSQHPGGEVPTASPLPGAGTVTPRPPVSSPPADERITDGHLSVVRGDTLWDLTRHLLGDGATDQQVAEALPLWAQVNRFPHGQDLIRPGDLLTVPPALSTRTTTANH